MSQTLKEIIAGFRTIPILFAGSGITRRYYNLPDWESLLKEFAMRIKNDPFSYRSYLISVKTDQTSETVFPKVASLMQTDFDRLWFQNSDFRRLKTDDFRFIESGTSPFKAEISAFLKEKSIIQSQYSEEISKLKNISVKNISAVITTNYDLFFESLFDGYKTYVGQEDLFFSAVQGIAEIYKIHGSVSDPGSLVLTEEDYSDFYDKSRYLASKLMTLFVEYPVIFIGYSLKDENIRRILSDIAYCLPDDKLKQLEKSLVFIEYQKDAAGAQVSSHSVFLGSKVISMTKITMSDFGLLYDELANKKSGVPVKLLRMFKEEIYRYAVTSKPGPLMHVADIDDYSRIDENSLAVSIGLSQNKTGELGLGLLVKQDDWYRNVVMDDLDELGYTYDQLLTFAYPAIRKRSNGYFPLYKYLHNARGNYPDILNDAAPEFEDLFSRTIKNKRNVVSSYSSVSDLWNHEKSNESRAYRLLCHLPEEKMDVDELGHILENIFKKDRDAFQHMMTDQRTNIRRLIRVYDFLKWRQFVIMKYQEAENE